MKEYRVLIENDQFFWLGDRFYKVEEKKEKNYSGTRRAVFTSKCPCCNDTHKVNFIGNDGVHYETECPICKGQIGKGYGNIITLKNWEVHEYIVYKLDLNGPIKISAYKSGTGYIESASLTAFCRTGRCMDEYIETRVPHIKHYIDPALSKINIKDIEAYKFDDYVFRRKKDAEELCILLKEYDKNRLANFNGIYKTNHIYPF